MQEKYAKQLRIEWKGKQCIHPSIEKEYYLGSQTGDYVCSTCGREFTDREEWEEYKHNALIAKAKHLVAQRQAKVRDLVARKQAKAHALPNKPALVLTPNECVSCGTSTTSINQCAKCLDWYCLDCWDSNTSESVACYECWDDIRSHV